MVLGRDIDGDLDAVHERVGHVDADSVDAVHPAVLGGDGTRGVRRGGLVVGQQVDIGACHGREVRRVLLLAPLAECRAAVEDQPDHRDDRDQQQGEEDEDLAALRALGVTAKRRDDG